MKISELRTGQGNVEVEGVVTEIGNTRVFNKYGRELKVADSILTDDSGSIKLTLWNDDVTRFKEGDRIKVINGYVSEFQGEKQLTSGKYGRMEKVTGKVDTGDEKEIKEEVNEEENKNKISSSLEKGQSKTTVVSKKDIKKKNEEGMDEYSEDAGEESTEEEPGEEELF